MSGHNSAVFNNSCLKVPRNPINRHPLPIYEQKYLNDLENREIKLESEGLNITNSSPISNKNVMKSYIEFYDSIPEYSDVNHLSATDFYRKLENLKEKQRSYYGYLQNQTKYDNKSTEWIEDYKNLTIRDKKGKPMLKEEIDSLCSSEKEHLKPPSRRSVRIESPSDKFSPELDSEKENFRCKSRMHISSASSKDANKSICSFNDSLWDDLSINESKTDFYKSPLVTRSAPNSPVKKYNVAWKDSVTIPKPFQMTVRDEENRIIDELILNGNKPVQEKHEMFRAHPVPVESRIPLFGKIMAEQELRRQICKKRCKASLKAQMRPFSFTRREEEIQAITRRLSKSSPNLLLESPIEIKQFKAKPVPKNLFSNYIYKKMHEDEFYRALQRKIRSEEMLKASSLPPSMAKRDKRPQSSICPRSCAISDYEFHKSEPKTSKKPRKVKSCYRSSSASSKNTDCIYSAADLQSVNRSNLAAVLRIQSARKRLEVDMFRKLEESKLRDEARWREKVLRKRPVWQTLAYSNEEDLAMRLQLRRDEERLRNEEHRHRMELMYGRVLQMPTLFERQSLIAQIKNPKMRRDALAKFHQEFYRYSDSPKLTLSDISVKSSPLGMKGEMQAIIDNELKIIEMQEKKDEENNEN